MDGFLFQLLLFQSHARFYVANIVTGDQAESEANTCKVLQGVAMIGIVVHYHLWE